VTELFNKTEIQGCYTFQSRLFKDQRGSFAKIYSQEIFKKMGLEIPVAEVFFSSSNKNVIRGMHFQTPPHDQAKVVNCISGRILDVVLDLRKNSPSYGKSMGLELSGENETTLFIPRGCAHGFYSYEDNSLVTYVVETNHNKEADQGVLWNSFGFKWPSQDVILSVRDQQFPTFQNFINPF
jgi:dTDP-4-dehydrorhamnose 3,5-epimerase